MSSAPFGEVAVPSSNLCGSAESLKAGVHRPYFFASSHLGNMPHRTTVREKALLSPLILKLDHPFSTSTLCPLSIIAFQEERRVKTQVMDRVLG